MERTLMLIKPDAVRKNLIGKILARVEEEGFRIIALKFLKLQKEEAEAFYSIHRGKPFFDDLVKFMISGKIVAVCMERENAISYWREVMGATDPQEAKEGTIRKLYGSSKQENAVHGSDSPENAQKEIAFFFSEKDLL